MWRYDGASCKAFFFLYPAGNSLAVRHVETVPRGAEMAADAGCLNALRARNGRLAPAVTARLCRFRLKRASISRLSFVLSGKRHRSRTTQTGHSGLRATQT